MFIVRVCKFAACILESIVGIVMQHIGGVGDIHAFAKALLLKRSAGIACFKDSGLILWSCLLKRIDGWGRFVSKIVESKQNEVPSKAE